MESKLQSYAADVRHLIDYAAKAAGLNDPVAFDLDDYERPLLKASRRGVFLPVDGAFIRDWDRDYRQTWPGINFGLRVYHFGDIPYVRITVSYALDTSGCGYDFYACSRSDYQRLFRSAIKCKRAAKPVKAPPVMPATVERALWQNTIAFLEPPNLALLKRFGGKAKRGLLLTGPPGNAKTSSCRWIYDECVRRNWDYKLVSADDYQAARRDDNPAEAVRKLFRVSRPGVVFFDDLDVALRDRNTVKETDDQSVFLTALDGIEGVSAVVYVFTTNCAIDLIDPAFRRPGRIDLTLHFPKPDAALREQMVGRWDEEIRTTVGINRVVSDSAGMSFAELEELKNLLILRYLDTKTWDWAWARREFTTHRDGLSTDRARRQVGFGAVIENVSVANGVCAQVCVAGL